MSLFDWVAVAVNAAACMCISLYAYERGYARGKRDTEQTSVDKEPGK